MFWSSFYVYIYILISRLDNLLPYYHPIFGLRPHLNEFFFLNEETVVVQPVGNCFTVYVGSIPCLIYFNFNV